MYIYCFTGRKRQVEMGNQSIKMVRIRRRMAHGRGKVALRHVVSDSLVG